MHAKCNWSAGFCSTTDLVELEAHKGFNESALTTRLVAHDDDSRGIEGLVEILSLQDISFITNN